MAAMAAFYDARNLYREYTGYTEPLSFDEWNKFPHHQKAALLFVQFFNEITLAWDKANAFDFIDGEDGVSVIGQYLEKNIAKIESEPKRFTPNYIYRVAYNCMYCICHDLKSVKDRWENETDSIVMYDGKELCLFDTVADKRGSAADKHASDTFEREFWAVIEDSGVSAEKVLRYLLSEDPADLKKLSTRCKRYKEGDPLRDVEVPLEAVEGIVKNLREKFLNLPQSSFCGSYISQFNVVAS